MHNFDDLKILRIFDFMDSIYNRNEEKNIIIKCYLLPLFFTLFRFFINTKYSKNITFSISDLSYSYIMESNFNINVRLDSNHNLFYTTIVSSDKNNLIIDEKEIRECFKKLGEVKI